MKRLGGQARWVAGQIVHMVGLLILGLVSLLGLAVFILAFRLSEGPIQLPFLASVLATAVSGQGITIHINQAALAWGGYRQGGAAPLYLKLGGIAAHNAAGLALAEVPDARLIFLPSALLGSKAPILVNSADAHFVGSNAGVSMLASIRLGLAFRLSSADLFITLGAGGLGAGGDSLPITGGGFLLHITPHFLALNNGELLLTPRGASAPVVKFSGAGQRDGDWHGALTITADAVHAQDLYNYWPAGLDGGARDWVTGNITAGLAHDGKITFGLAAPTNLSRIDVNSLAGGFTGTNMTMNWIPHAHPITALSGTLAVLSPDSLLITVTSAALGKLALSHGTMNITGLTKPRQTGAVKVAVAGSVQDAIAVLNAPPLSLLRAAPSQLAEATGGLTATATATLPLINNLTLDAVNLDLRAQLTGVAVPTPFAGLGFSDGALALRTSTAAITVAGIAKFADEPATVAAQADFRSAPALRRFTMHSLLGPTFLHDYGLDAATDFTDPVAGAVPFDLAVTATPSGETATLNADMTGAKLGVPAFGWSKPAGAKGRLTLNAALNNGAFGSLTALAATAPQLDILGRASGGVLVLSVADIGETRAVGSIAPSSATAPWRIKFAGPELSLRAILNPPTKGEAKQAARATPGATTPNGPVWQATLRFTKFRLAKAPAPILQNFSFIGTGQGGTVLTASSHALSQNGFPVSLAIARAPAHRRDLDLAATDGGEVLRVLGAYDDMQGGELILHANYGDNRPLTGLVTVRQFRLLQAPAIGKVLQGLTIYGVAEATSGPGLEFDQLVAPFSIARGTLTLSDARAYSASLGFTASGDIALADGNCDLSGTIIPAYALNALPGKIPVVGKLFTAEKGGGLFAVRARVSGLLADPRVTVNPLSALTPGVLRDVFGGAAEQK
jgi:hypothetical protein